MLNRIVLVGRLTRDPEFRGGEVAVARFTLASDNAGPRTEDGKKQTTFIDCVVFRNQAENVAKYVRKGSLVAIDGKLVQRNYLRKDGSRGSTFEIMCDNVQFLEPKSENPMDKDPGDDISQVAPEEEVDESKNLDSLDIVDDDLPF